MATDDTLKGLECLVGKARLLVPSEFVEGVIEVEISPPPPLGRKWVGGLGIHAGQAVLCVSLVASPDGHSRGRRTVKGILFTVQESEISWVLEVNAVKAFQTVKRLPKRVPGTGTVPSWIGAASDEAGLTLGWVDVTSMVKELAGSA